MLRFDWRRFEPEEAREHDSAQLDRNPLARYSPIDVRGQPINGFEAWAVYVPRLLAECDKFPPPPGLIDDLLAIADEFYAAVDRSFPPSPSRPDCVFVSHQRLDTRRGERVACLVEDHGLDAWLDVHDPTLTHVNASLCGPLRSILIAFIVEMALLNSTHVIALHTTHSVSSRWVPYELARAKARGLTSLQAAGWFEPGQTPQTCGDYVQLAVMTHDEPQVVDWIRKQIPGAKPVTVRAHCKTHNTNTLV
jgi:hypothetical protein